MKSLVDIHAHRSPQMPGTAIVNCYPDVFAPKTGEWYSVGIHPWHIPATVTPAIRHEMDILAFLAGHPQVLAIGEAGLDKLAGVPQAVQVEVFEYQARLSMELGKPLVIHLVKAVDELLKLKQQIRPANPWIIHGFRGKAVLAKEYLRHGFYLSFGEKYQEEALRITPSDRLFLETDESDVPIADLYSRAAQARCVSLSELTEAVQENIAKVFFKQ
ncbi:MULTISPECIES: TatD family hydrolase [Bacteroides]|jgi:TatD DNase family protein|uniref:TatD family hydrolase n=1 Tax=Bacteroides TaxID=816 RepID=UPI000E451957|nr:MULTISPECIES: TatD family hydrolase [Bacteroides]MBS7573312.1 TatD family hydrolase [Bacteroides propionicigenes]RGM30901.1 TatD family deoxyribonuclease [Bacteroides sp. OM08-17BH]RHJ54093.1 TatD family deoxyribonuclease [Bacteroides sp. AM10-21B]HBO07979.1 hydrolase TatD [Bacteroides sp.]